MTQINENTSTANLEDLKMALDDSSDKNRQFLIAFFMLEIYLLFSVLSTTDLDLFLANSVFAFPFINLDISLVAFFVIGPLVLVAFHYNLLFNLLEHCKTLRDWLYHPDNNRLDNFNLLHAFMFNIRAKYDDYPESPRTINYYLLNVIIIFTVSLSPLLLLVLMMWHFASFQHLWISLWQLVLVLVSLILHVFYWLRLQNPELLDKKYDHIETLYRPLLANRLIISYLVLVLVICLTRFSTLLFALYKPVMVAKYMDNPVVNFMVPHIDIRGAKITPVIDTPEQASLNPLLSKDTKKQLPRGVKFKTVSGCPIDTPYHETDLSHRHLTLANLSYVTLCNINMTEADLRGARLRNSVFSGRFDLADMSRADLSHSQIQRHSSMMQTTLRNANLSYVLANQVNFTMADLQGAILWASQLNLTDFLQANLQQAHFTLTQTQFSNFRGANFASSKFEQTQLNAVDLRFAQHFDRSVTFDNSHIKNCYVDDLNVVKISHMYLNANCAIYNSKLLKDDSSEAETISQLQTQFKKNSATTFITQNQNSQILIDRIIAVTKLSHTQNINLSNLALSDIPEEITAIKQLENLNLAYNHLDSDQLLTTTLLEGLKVLNFGSNDVVTVPKEINQLTQLTELNLAGNQLVTLPFSLSELKHLTTLNINNNQFTTLPSAVGELSQLQSLSLKGNTLSQFPHAINQLIHLKRLSFGENNLTELPAHIGHLIQLKQLNLSSNELTSIPNEMGQLVNLTDLNLSENELTELPAQIGNLTRLTALNLSFNGLTSLPKQIGQLKRLPALDLESNALSQLPDEVVQLSKLTALNINDNEFVNFPEQITQLKHLKKLNLEGNGLSLLPPDIGKLLKLEELYLGGNTLSTLPIEIGQLHRLTTLQLQGNEITTLPTQISQLGRLKILALSANQLSQWPAQEEDFSQLTELDLGYNNFAVLPVQFGQLKQLNRLNMASNQLTVLPPQIGDLPQLTTLNLDSNQLSDLPAQIALLAQLQSLTLSGNQLSEVPTVIGELHRLSTLNLAANNLTTLPQALVKLSNLKTLNLKGNQLTRLPQAIVNLPLLETLNVRGNQLVSPPQKVANRGLQAIRAWFADNE